MTERERGIQDFVGFLATSQERIEDFAALLRSEFELSDVFSNMRARSGRAGASIELYTHAIFAEDRQVVWWLELCRARGSWSVKSEIGEPLGKALVPMLQERADEFPDARDRVKARIESWFTGLEDLRDKL